MIKKSTVLAVSVVLSCALSSNLLAADEPLSSGNAEEGKVKAALCIACHGENGEGKVMQDGQPAAPLLAGQISAYFVKAMNDYKTDKRADPLMNALSKGLTDADVANLAAYYQSLGAK